MTADVDLLILPDALADAGSAAFDVDLVPADDDVLEREMRWAIAHAQEAVAGALGFHPLAHLATADLVPHAAYARRDGYGSPARYLVPTVGPVVEPFTAGVTGSGGRLTFETAPADYRVTYAAGWRGAHHTLTDDDPGDLRQRDGLDGLTVLPGLLPGDVRSVLVEVALVELDRRRNDKLGGKRKVVAIGDGEWQSDGYRPDAERLALSRLSPVHRAVTV